MHMYNKRKRKSGESKHLFTRDSENPGANGQCSDLNERHALKLPMSRDRIRVTSAAIQ